MRLLSNLINAPLSNVIPVPGDHSDGSQPYGDSEADPGPRILWAAEVDNKKIIVVDDHPRTLFVVYDAFRRDQYQGHEAITNALIALGISNEDSAEARKALPAEISDELPLAVVATANKGRKSGQFALFHLPDILRKAG